MKPHQRVRCWGIPGGPYPGIVIREGQSKDCWIVKIRHENGIVRVELHEDYIREYQRSRPIESDSG